MAKTKEAMPRPLVVKKLEDSGEKDCVVGSCGGDFLLVAPGFEPDAMYDFDAEKMAALMARGYGLAILDEIACPGVKLIDAERRRQVEVEGWSTDHDDEHDDGSLANAAACYAATGNPREAILAHWPWLLSWWKPGDGSRDGRIRELQKAGALIAAELARLVREKKQEEGDEHE